MIGFKGRLSSAVLSSAVLSSAVMFLIVLMPAQAGAKDHPDKPAHIVIRDAKIICPVIVSNMNKRGGRESAVDVLRFAVARKYSRSDTKALLRLCSLYAQSAR